MAKVKEKKKDKTPAEKADKKAAKAAKKAAKAPGWPDKPADGMPIVHLSSDTPPTHIELLQAATAATARLAADRSVPLDQVVSSLDKLSEEVGHLMSDLDDRLTAAADDGKDDEDGSNV